MNANKKVFSDNLKKYLRKKNISQSEFAKLLNYPETTVSNWINANTYPRIDKIEEISRFFGITKSELTEEKLPENLIKISRVTMIPVLGEIACGDPIWVSENYDGYFALDNSLNADFILVAKGESMIDAGINDGDKCFIRKQEYIDSGKIGVVLLDDSATLKRIYKSEKGYILQPENRDYSPLAIEGDIKILGELVGVYKTYF